MSRSSEIQCVKFHWFRKNSNMLETGKNQDGIIVFGKKRTEKQILFMSVEKCRKCFASFLTCHFSADRDGRNDI